MPGNVTLVPESLPSSIGRALHGISPELHRRARRPYHRARDGTRTMRAALAHALVPDAEETAIASALALSAGIQLDLAQVRWIVGALRLQPTSRFLVFGCGNDSPFWETVNADGTTIFLEDSEEWATRIGERLTRSSLHLVAYGTELPEWRALLDHPEQLELELPSEVTAASYDVILVDGPAGYPEYFDEFGTHPPGRMKSIFMASQLVRPGGRVFVHDCHREVELEYTARYLGDSRIICEVPGVYGTLRGFQM
jgi:hypothetical protein